MQSILLTICWDCGYIPEIWTVRKICRNCGGIKALTDNRVMVILYKTANIALKEACQNDGNEKYVVTGQDKEFVEKISKQLSKKAIDKTSIAQDMGAVRKGFYVWLI